MLCIAGIAKCSRAKGETRFAGRVEMPPRHVRAGHAAGDAGAGSGEAAAAAPAEVPANVSFTEKFRLEGSKNIEVRARPCRCRNSWAYASVDLVNDKTGSVVSFDTNLE